MCLSFRRGGPSCGVANGTGKRMGQVRVGEMPTHRALPRATLDVHLDRSLWQSIPKLMPQLQYCVPLNGAQYSLYEIILLLCTSRIEIFPSN